MLLTGLTQCSATQAFQDDDPRKYSVATVLVRVLAVNRFHPVFDMAEYHGFVTAAKNPASLVYTYGNRALMLHVQDQDFKHVGPLTKHPKYNEVLGHCSIVLAILSCRDLIR